jgi:hypothetical protein
MGAAVTEAFIALPLRTQAGFHFFLDPAEEYQRVAPALALRPRKIKR